MATYTDTQIMMTLAAFTADGAAARPSGETPAQQAARIGQGITAQLALTDLATQGNWSLTWVGLTQSGANLAYIAQGPNDSDGNSTYALILRGTVMGNPIDTAQDMQVGLMLPFAAGGTPTSGSVGNISQGAMAAFTDIVMGTDLVSQLESSAPYTLYVVGHSLGGAMATTVALFLQQLVSAGTLSITSILPYTFAAPTAGDANFAAWFDSQFPGAVCTYNKYDLVPNAWATLASLPGGFITHPFYPGSNSNPAGPGPTAEPLNEVGILIDTVAKETNGNTYVQPTQQAALNGGPSPLFLTPYPPAVTNSLQQFELQVGFQHGGNTYLTLLGAPTITSSAPVVAAVSPASGTIAGGTSVTITPPSGSSFTADCVVDFGIAPAASQTVASDGSSITAVSPPGYGTVDIRVTNMFGTSPAVPVYPNLTGDDYSDQYTFSA
ncbi:MULTISPECIES: lipase family protein [unclassified Inquilinus]|uniref:lipase family protein n=1 Tax=unclassified Inquilinus TaxID=2645927 RepID=UPI003F918410